MRSCRTGTTADIIILISTALIADAFYHNQGYPVRRPATPWHRINVRIMREEYNDPLDRRFHAQPNACFDCGPHMHLHDANGNPIVHGYDADSTRELITEAAKLLSGGSIIAIKGIGGFHLAVNAMDDLAVMRLRKLKNRERKRLR